MGSLLIMARLLLIEKIDKAVGGIKKAHDTVSRELSKVDLVEASHLERWCAALALRFPRAVLCEFSSKGRPAGGSTGGGAPLCTRRGRRRRAEPCWPKDCEGKRVKSRSCFLLFNVRKL